MSGITGRCTALGWLLSGEMGRVLMGHLFLVLMVVDVNEKDKER